MPRQQVPLNISMRRCCHGWRAAARPIHARFSPEDAQKTGVSIIAKERGVLEYRSVLRQSGHFRSRRTNGAAGTPARQALPWGPRECSWPRFARTCRRTRPLSSLFPHSNKASRYGDKLGKQEALPRRSRSGSGAGSGPVPPRSDSRLVGGPTLLLWPRLFEGSPWRCNGDLRAAAAGPDCFFGA